METPYTRYMTKSELILRLAKRYPRLYASDVERIVNTIFGEVTEALVRGDRVELRGFGAFFARKRNARTGRNPRTGEIVTVEARARPFFKTGTGQLIPRPQSLQSAQTNLDARVTRKPSCKFDFSYHIMKSRNVQSPAAVFDPKPNRDHYGCPEEDPE